MLWNAPWQKKSHLTLGIEREETQLSLSVQGSLPLWLEGMLVRNSSIPIDKDGKQISHPFNGLAMLHGFDFQQGKVFYTNGFLRSNDYEQVVHKGNTHYAGFASTSCSTIWEKIQQVLFAPKEEIQNALINVFQFGKSYVALTEVPLPVRFDLKTLQTRGPFTYEDDLPHCKCWESAYPHFDTTSKEILNYLIEFGPESHYVLYRLPYNSSSRELIAKIPTRLPSYMHSFAMTEHYIILTEFPLLIHPLDLMRGDSLEQSMRWQMGKKTRFLIVARDSGQLVAQAETDPFFNFHHANAYEEGEEIILDLVTYPDISMMKDIFPQALGQSVEEPHEGRKLMRYHFSLPKQQILRQHKKIKESYSPLCLMQKTKILFYLL